MSGQSLTRYSLAFVVLQVVWFGQPVSAQVPLPADLISPQVPHDVPTGSAASIQDLAVFGWREFIALNWTAMDPATTGMRGRANVNSNFLTINADSGGSYPLLVWQTYRHKNELFPADGQTDPSFDSSAPPSYKYRFPATAAGNATYNLFNNLDESSEISLCQMFAHADTRIVYEAKVNRAVFDYANKNGLTQCDKNQNCNVLFTTLGNTMNNLAQYGGSCKTNSSTPIVSLPCGDATMEGDAGEGAIEIKAAWRQLTNAEMASGRFYTRKVIYYQGGGGSQSQGSQQYYNAVFGLVGLHIIHKTKSFPTFVFATWEQVDNFDNSTNTNTENLTFINVGTTLPNIPVTRAHPIHSQIPPVNDAVHALFKAQAPNTVWQYYKLVGVQAMPMDGPPPSQASSDTNSYYYLANIVVETNQTLQNFFGQAPTGVTEALKNVYLNGTAGSPFQMGGCQGCHGAEGQANGADMSPVIAFAPFNSNNSAESIDLEPEPSLRSYRARTAAKKPR